MILHFLQIAAIAVVALCFVRWKVGIRRQGEQSWETLIARLRPDWSASQLSGHFLWKEGLDDATPEETWRRLQGAYGLWAMYQNAGVLLQMADFASRHCDSVDRVLLETLRSDAMQIRVCVLVALAQYAFSHANEGVRVNAFRAASMYTGMAARMTELLQASAADTLPGFVAAM